MPVATFSALSDLISTAVGEDAEVVVRASAWVGANSAVAVKNLTQRQIAQRLRAAATLIDGAPRVDPKDSAGPTLTLGSAIRFGDGGVDVNIGFDDATREQGLELLGGIAKALTDSFQDTPEAPNYLECSWPIAPTPASPTDSSG